MPDKKNHSPIQIQALWERYFRLKEKQQAIQEASDDWPETKSFFVEYWDLDKSVGELAEMLLEDPENVLKYGEKAIKEIATGDLEKVDLNLRITGIPETNVSAIRNLRAESLGKFIGVEGLVRRFSGVRPTLVEATFECMRCYAHHKLTQRGVTLKEPLFCDKDNGGCGKSSGTSFRLVSNLSQYQDANEIEIMEFPESVTSGRVPERLGIIYRDDMAGVLVPGDKVIANGTLMEKQKYRGGRKSTTFDIYLEGNNFELLSRSYEDIKLTPEEIKEFEEMASSVDIQDKIVSSICPAIYGMYMEKFMLALLLHGGVRKKLPDGSYRRGDIHGLLVGDPGTAKSMLMDYIAELAPKCVRASGKTSSPAGLTAAAVKEEGSNRYNLEAGAMALADGGEDGGGLFTVDELDKMNKSDREVMNEALEQQEIHIAKAGVSASIKTRCSMLASANPKEGRYDLYLPLSEQFDFAPALLSRIDIVLPIQDFVDKEQDKKIASHVLKVHRGGEIARERAEHGDEQFNQDDQDESWHILEQSFEKPWLRKYIAYSKMTVYPVMTKRTMRALEDYYVGMRQRGLREGETVSITVRQLEALIRLCEARARMRMSKKVEIEDVQEVVKLLEYYLSKVANEGGVFDIGKLDAGGSKTQRDRVTTILDLIREEDDGHGAKVDKVRTRFTDLKFDGELFDKDIEKLKRSNRIFFPRDGVVKVIT